MHDNPKQLAAFFDTLCAAAAEQTLSRFRLPLDIANKLDSGFDPVTEGDREAEKAIRALLKEHLPNDGIVGEEFGRENENAAFQWIIDPIDGTRAFISGIPVWGTLIGLYKDGVPYAGVMDQPFTGERYVALPGSQPTLSLRNSAPQPLATRATENLEAATLMTTSPNIFPTDHKPRYDALERTTKLVRYGCDCYAYAMVASGQVDMVAESGLSSYDIAALIPIIEGAGGVVSTWDGESAAQGGTVLASANRTLHEKALKALSP
ncbi:histidinol-phosphatase [Pseudahrensia aquimaris]|uniref:Histidinol-phosphatase n=1 Tax=Pseudahrensia aquimaris TaxID=744461 RepID=A0ABW3FCT0_9HYPH